MLYGPIMFITVFTWIPHPPFSVRFSPCHSIIFLKDHFHIVSPSVPLSSRWSLSFKFPHHNPTWISFRPYTYHVWPSHYPWFYHSNIWRGVQIVTVFMMFSTVSCYFLSFRPKYLLQQPTVEHTKPCYTHCALPISWMQVRRPLLESRNAGNCAAKLTM